MTAQTAAPGEALSVERRTELLARADAAELVELAERCIAELGDPVVFAGPDVGVVMMQVREPVVGERFHVGEVVVTRVEVAVDDRRGWAMRLGTDRVAALAAAVCDAAATHGRWAGEVAALCERVAAGLEDAERAEWGELAATEVRFEELD